MSEPKVLRGISLPKCKVLCTAVCGVKQFFAAGLSNGTINVFPFDPSTKPFKLTGHKGAVTCLQASKTGILASGGADGTVRFWENNETISVISLGTSGVKSMSLTPSFDRLLVTTNSNSTSIWDPFNCVQIQDIKNRSNLQVNCSSISENGIVSLGYENGTFKVFDTRAGIFTNTISINDPITCLCNSNASPYIIIGCQNGTIYVWDIKNERFVGKNKSHKEAITSLDYHPSGNFFISGSKDKTISIFDAKIMKHTLTLNCHTGSVLSLKFSLSGDAFSSCGEDNRVVLWEFPYQSLATATETEAKAKSEEEEAELKEMERQLEKSVPVRQTQMQTFVSMIHDVTDQIVSLSTTVSKLEQHMNDMDKQIAYLEDYKRKQAQDAIRKAQIE